MRKPLQLVTLLSRKSPNAEWGIRNKFDSEHSDMRAGKISIQQLMNVAELAKTRWQVHEPDTEFKVEVHG